MQSQRKTVVDKPSRVAKQLLKTVVNGSDALSSLIEKNHGDRLVALRHLADAALADCWPTKVCVSTDILRLRCVELDKTASLEEVDVVLTIARAFVNLQYAMVQWKSHCQEFVSYGDNCNLMCRSPDEVRKTLCESKTYLASEMEGFTKPLVVDGVRFTRPEALLVLELSPMISVQPPPRIVVPRDWVLIKVLERVTGTTLAGEEVADNDAMISLSVRAIVKAIERYNNVVAELADIYFGSTLPVQ